MLDGGHHTKISIPNKRQHGIMTREGRRYMNEEMNRVCLRPDCESQPVKHVRYDYKFSKPIFPRERRGVETPFTYEHGDVCAEHLADLCRQYRGVSQIAFGACCP